MALTKAEKAVLLRTMARTFNRTWDLILKVRRTPGDDREMLSLIHTSRYCAYVAGTDRNRAIGDWMVSRVYAALHEPELALTFAESSLRWAKPHRCSELRCSAYEGIARAHVVAAHLTKARAYLQKAKSDFSRLHLDAEGREIFQGQIEETEDLIRRRSRPRRR